MVRGGIAGPGFVCWPRALQFRVNLLTREGAFHNPRFELTATERTWKSSFCCCYLFSMACSRYPRWRSWHHARRAYSNSRMRATIALALARNPTRFLSTIQVGITFVGIFTGAFGQAALANGLGQALAAYPALAGYSDALALAIVVVAIAYFSLIIGELVRSGWPCRIPSRLLL